MTPQNTKSLFVFLCEQMEKLNNKEITVEDAKAQANLAKQVNNVLRYELDRVNTEIKVSTFNLQNGSNVTLREVEPKAFDNTNK